MYFLAHCREDNYCNYWTYEEHLEINDDRRCSLMTTCEKTSVSPYPVLTTSGNKECNPEPVKRRKCSGCPQERPFCHGRAVFTGRGVPEFDTGVWQNQNCTSIILLLFYPSILFTGGNQCRCLFHPCSKSPYRTSPDSCFELAHRVEAGNCHRACSSWNGPETCQECIEEDHCPHEEMPWVLRSINSVPLTLFCLQL